MNESQLNEHGLKYLNRHDILAYYYNTYIGLAIIFMALVFLKMKVFPWQACLVLVGIVSIRVIYGVCKMAPAIACPFCKAGNQKRKWFSNIYYLSTIPLEKETFECPTCGQKIKIIDQDE